MNPIPLWAAHRKARTGKNHVPCQVWASGNPPFNKILDKPKELPYELSFLGLFIHLCTSLIYSLLFRT